MPMDYGTITRDLNSCFPEFVLSYLDILDKCRHTCMTKDKFYLLGYASGIAGANGQVGEGPIRLQQSSYMHHLQNDYQWVAMLHPVQAASPIASIQQICTELAKTVSGLTR